MFLSTAHKASLALSRSLPCLSLSLSLSPALPLSIPTSRTTLEPERRSPKFLSSNFRRASTRTHTERVTVGERRTLPRGRRRLGVLEEDLPALYIRAICPQVLELRVVKSDSPT